MTVVKNPIEVMKRTELKYVLDPVQTRYMMAALQGRMEPDQFGLTQIASLYYDTEDMKLIANSIEKPPFKEKIRVRSYGLAAPVFYPIGDCLAAKNVYEANRLGFNVAMDIGK